MNSDLLVDEAPLLSPADHRVRGASSVDCRLAVYSENSSTIDGRQLLSQQGGLRGELVVVPRETGHLTGSDVINNEI